MKNLNRIFLLGFIILLSASCAVKKQYKRATMFDSIAAYEAYLRKFPNSKYRPEVVRRLLVLHDDAAWRRALLYKSLNAYKDYLKEYPKGRHSTEARTLVEMIEKKNEEKSAWDNATRLNTVEAYQSFIRRYPNSSHATDARSNLRKLIEEDDWQKALSVNTITSYNEYLRQYNDPKYGAEARARIEALKEANLLLPEWEETVRNDSYQAYKTFKEKHPNSSYAQLAQARMTEIEKGEWEKAVRANTKKAYRDFIRKYPLSDLSEIAERRVIDLEVDSIFKGDHGQLPPMSRNSTGYSASTVSSVEIYNNTRYTLTIRYSGVESKKIVLSPRQRTTTRLKNGTYRIAASVNASYVRNYAGTENLSGDTYSSEYYIVTQTITR